MAESALRSAAISWLLEYEEPAVRHLALRDLVMPGAGDPDLTRAREAAHAGGAIAEVLAEQKADGYWVEPGPGYNPKYRSTVWAVILLAQLGASANEDERVARGCNYLLDHALSSHGRFSASGAPSGTADCLQGNLCWALWTLGCRDARLEAAFDWLARSVTGDGIAGQDERNAPLRFYAGKCGPGFACGSNEGHPCAWGAVKVALGLSTRPDLATSPLFGEARRVAAEFLLAGEPAAARYPLASWSAAPNRSWWKFGFPVFYVTDIMQIVESVGALGFGDDPRLSPAIELVRGKADASGRWKLEYGYEGKTWGDYGRLKEPNPWVTLRAHRALNATG